jgi:hypothetical protein
LRDLKFEVFDLGRRQVRQAADSGFVIDANADLTQSRRQRVGGYRIIVHRVLQQFVRLEKMCPDR